MLANSALYVGHLIKLVVGQLPLLKGDDLDEVPVKVWHLGDKIGGVNFQPQNSAVRMCDGGRPA